MKTDRLLIGQAIMAAYVGQDVVGDRRIAEQEKCHPGGSYFSMRQGHEGDVHPLLASQHQALHVFDSRLCQANAFWIVRRGELVRIAV